MLPVSALERAWVTLAPRGGVWLLSSSNQNHISSFRQSVNHLVQIEPEDRQLTAYPHHPGGARSRSVESVLVVLACPDASFDLRPLAHQLLFDLSTNHPLRFAARC